MGFLRDLPRYSFAWTFGSGHTWPCLFILADMKKGGQSQAVLSLRPASGRSEFCRCGLEMDVDGILKLELEDLRWKTAKHFQYPPITR